MEDRKKDHISLALNSQTPIHELDTRFTYEPVLSAHPKELEPFQFLGATFHAPLWVSSMTGGTQAAKVINTNLAKACKEFGFGMGLGSCRSLLTSDEHLEDFNVRKYIGDEMPLFANLGICQLEELVENNNVYQVKELVEKLEANGLIIHVNPMQEWFQPEGDRLNQSPLYTIMRLLDKLTFPLIVKEVGQGMGPKSLEHLLKLPLAAIEFGAFGGTNFAKLELQRNPSATLEVYEPLSKTGADAFQMLEAVNQIVKAEGSIRCRQIIISGGIKSFLDGYYLLKKSSLPAVFGQASTFLKYAQGDYSRLQHFVTDQINGLAIANAYLQIRE